MRYQKLNSGAVISDADNAYSFEVMEDPREFNEHRDVKSTLDWQTVHSQMGAFRVFPYGAEDNLPTIIRDTVKNNNEAPGMLKKKVQLMWGQGPMLYKRVLLDGHPSTMWVENKEIQSWLESWDYKDYLMRACVDVTHMEGHFTKYIPGRKSINTPWINKLEHCPMDRARLAYQMDSQIIEPTHAIVSDRPFGQRYHNQQVWRSYPLFDIDNITAQRTVEYSSFYSFCQDIYNVPDIMGTLGWLMRSNEIPRLFKYMADNSLSAKYHIQSPQRYWDQKKQMLQERCKEKGEPYTNDVFEQYKEEVLQSVARVLSGIKNTGKYWHSETYVDESGVNLVEYGWKIEAIDQNIKEFVDSQIAISERAAYAISTGLNMNAALSNVDSNNRANSGSTLIYAINNHLSTVDMDEIIACKAINKAIRVNFPDSDERVGFYHATQLREEQVSPENRNKNLPNK
jgi:hypothetical protein